MNSQVTTFVGSNNNAPNGYTGKGQTQFLASGSEVASMTASVNKGGMRGIAVALIALAEAKLKADTLDLAEDYYEVNKKDYDAFIAIHKDPIAQTVSEAMSPTINPTYTYDLYASVPSGIGKMLLTDRQWFQVRRRAHRYATGMQKRIDYQFSIARMHAIASGWNIGRRYEINWADDHNNRRFDRIIAASNIGIGVGNIVRAGLASSVSKLASAQDNLGDTISTVGNGLAARSGYIAGRHDTGERYKAMTSASGVEKTSPNKSNIGIGTGV